MLTSPVKKKILIVFINFFFICVGWYTSKIYHSESLDKSLSNDIPAVVETVPDTSYLTALENLLSEYEDKIDSLMNLNSLMKSKIGFLDDKKSLITAIPSFRKKINSMSDNEIKSAVQGLIRHKHQLKEVEDYKVFALSFMDLALEEDELPDDVSDGDYLMDVRISVSKHSSTYIDVSDNDFKMSKYYKLFANVSSSPPLKNILLKWKNLESGELIKYEVIGTASESDIAYVWARPKAGWEVATYQISLHKLDDPLSLIAKRLYRISSVIDEGEQPSNNGNALQRVQ